MKLGAGHNRDRVLVRPHAPYVAPTAANPRHRKSHPRANSQEQLRPLRCVQCHGLGALANGSGNGALASDCAVRDCGSDSDSETTHAFASARHRGDADCRHGCRDVSASESGNGADDAVVSGSGPVDACDHCGFGFDFGFDCGFDCAACACLDSGFGSGLSTAPVADCRLDCDCDCVWERGIRHGSQRGRPCPWPLPRLVAPAFP
mmetsp:Transcript_10342/g.32835  ORF Transcript_10342/g.32835 Transcript_10342/m.32835 type:complete len:205 (+) Transcript_10342:359-973(+)